MRRNFSRSKYKIFILEGTPRKIWKKIRGFNNKKDAQRCWEHINRERVTAQYRLQDGTNIIEQTQ